MSASVFYRLGAVLVVLLISACSTPHLNYDVATSNELNQDSDGSAYAVLLRVYQLTDPELFEQAGYAALWKTDTEVLGGTLVSRKELTVEPGQDQVFSIKKVEAARYTGVVAFFRSQDGVWKASRKVNYGVIPASTDMELSIEDHSITLGYQ